MRTIASPFVGRAAPADAPSIRQRWSSFRRALLAALDRLVPPHNPAREPELPPEWYRFPPF